MAKVRNVTMARHMTDTAQRECVLTTKSYRDDHTGCDGANEQKTASTSILSLFVVDVYAQ